MGAEHLELAQQVSVSVEGHICKVGMCFVLHLFAVCNIARRDEAMYGLKKPSGLPGEEFKDFTTSVIEYNTEVSFCQLKCVNILKYLHYLSCRFQFVNAIKLCFRNKKVAPFGVTGSYYGKDY